MKLKMLACLLALVSHSTQLAAQTTMSFAGTTWGESLQTTNEKLKAAGFSGCGFAEIMACKAAGMCTCRFTGPSIAEGVASYSANRLEGIQVHGVEWAETAVLLKSKYRAFFVRAPGAVNDDLLLGETTNFQTKSGESIQLDPWGSLSYRSPALNARLQAKNAAKRGAF